MRLAGLQALAAQAENAAEDSASLDALRAGDTEATVIAALESDSDEMQRAAVAVLGALGTVDAIAPLRALVGKSFVWRLRSTVERAVDQIQARLPGGAGPGRVALAEGAGLAKAGRVGLVQEQCAGRVALPEGGG